MRAAIGVLRIGPPSGSTAIIVRPYVFVKWRHAEGLRGAQAGTPRADPRRRPARVRPPRLRGSDGRTASRTRRGCRAARSSATSRTSRRSSSRWCAARPTGSSRSGSSTGTGHCWRRSRTRIRNGSPSRSRPPGACGRTSGSASSSHASSEDVKAQRESRFARLRGVTRDDVPIEVIAQFLGTLANGVAFARVTDDPMPDLDQLMTLIETGVGAALAAARDAEAQRAAQDGAVCVATSTCDTAAAGDEEVAGKLRARGSSGSRELDARGSPGSARSSSRRRAVCPYPCRRAGRRCSRERRSAGMKAAIVTVGAEFGSTTTSTFSGLRAPRIDGLELGGPPRPAHPDERKVTGDHRALAPAAAEVAVCARRARPDVRLRPRRRAPGSATTRATERARG